MTFQESLERFEAATRSVSTGQRRVILSAVRNALGRATGRSDLDSIDICPYAESLPEHAQRYAEEHGLTRPADYATRHL